MKLYLCEAVRGEWGDYYRWVVGVFDTLELAQEVVKAQCDERHDTHYDPEYDDNYRIGEWREVEEHGLRYWQAYDKLKWEPTRYTIREIEVNKPL